MLEACVFFCSLSVGVRFTSYHGNFMLRSTDLLALPAVDCDKAYAAQLSLEETLLTTQTVYFQVALLYPYLTLFLCNYLFDHILQVSTYNCQILCSNNMKGKFLFFWENY